ncbi:FAD-dependent oxidoreductase [Amycolatopsis eburnea]|uniref:FAD-dependent monooxygenase n=1 Tax=Amycolatopsis eburnea TaxID=2267691 RepID=A0A3R9ERL8_9PSEU|nr:FAD-dependent monooxygenase [Amycolatopsis eburnea]RSD19468.1 FAD-dependent monooxygenase [Amycolatopsis eburnea]
MTRRVLVIGGGIGGLCLAHALRQSDVDVVVHERAAVPSPRHRLRITPDGAAAFRACLPPPVFGALVATSMRYTNGMAAYDEQLVPKWEHDDPDDGDPDRVDAVDHRTLREVLLTGLGEIVRYGKEFARAELTPSGGVRAHFRDGASDEGDVLVAADGADSAVRAAWRPADVPRDLGVRAIVSRIPMARAIKGGLPDFMRDRFTSVVGAAASFGLLPMEFRPGADAEDYYTAVFNAHRDDLGVPDDVLFGLSGGALREVLLDRTAGWHPDLHGLFEHVEPAETHALALRASVPVRPWGQGPVVPLGDAAHTMPLSGGAGANVAAQDAAALRAALVAPGLLSEALAEYQSDLVRRGTAAVEESVRLAAGSMRLD